jgi:hypothetical protein
MAIGCAALLAALAPWSPALADATPDPAPAQEAAAPEPAPDAAPQAGAEGPAGEVAGEPARPASNLRILLEGNRRWCARSSEQIWPAKPKVLGRRPMTRRRFPSISTLAYAYYILAQPQKEPVETPPAAEAGAGDAPSPLAEMIARGESIEEEFLRDTPPEEIAAPEEAIPAEQAAPLGQAVPAEEAAAATEAAAPGAGAVAAGTAEPEEPQPQSAPAEPPPAPFGIVVDMASRPGTVVLTQSPVYHTLTRRRVNRPGQPLKVQSAWDNSRSCCNLPTLVEASLPAGRYAIQAHFDALFAGRGWKPVQVARIEGIEIKEGEVTEVRLRVDAQGYVAINPAGRVVEFPDAIPPQTAPAETAPPPAEPLQAEPPAGPGL